MADQTYDPGSDDLTAVDPARSDGNEGIVPRAVARGLIARGRSIGAAVGIALLTMALALAATVSVATAAVGDITEFSSGLHPESRPEGITPGPDGQLWFGNTINAHPNAVGRITTTGSITEIYAPGEYIWPESIVRGLDGNLWVVDGTKAIYRLTPEGEWTKFDEGPRVEFRPREITRGAEGNLWFTVVGGEPRAIGRMTPDGQITEYRAGLNPGDFPQQITAGPDGNVWFTDTGTTPAIGRVTPNGEITEFSEGLGAGSVVLGITAGPDGDVWFTNSGTSSIGRITPTGEVTDFGLTLPFTTYPQDIAAGPDGNLWFTAPSVWTTSYIGRITTAGVITLFPMALKAGGIPYPHRISPGADGNMWFTDFGGTPAIGRIETGAPQAVKTPPTMTGIGEVGSTLRCEGESWEIWAGEAPTSPGPGESPAPVQWTRDGRSIPGATQRTYTLGSDDRGHSISCTAAVVYPLLDVVATATSNAVTLPPPPRAPEEPPGPQSPGQVESAPVVPIPPPPDHPSVAPLHRSASSSFHCATVSGRSRCELVLMTTKKVSWLRLKRHGTVYARGRPTRKEGRVTLRFRSDAPLPRGTYALEIISGVPGGRPMRQKVVLVTHRRNQSSGTA